MQFPWHNNRAEDELFADLMVIGGVWNVAAYWMEKHNELEAAFLANEIVRSLSRYKEYV